MDDAIFYKYSQGKIRSFSGQFSQKIRRQIVAKFLSVSKITPEATVLDVGVTPDDENVESNVFETAYPYKQKIIGVGVTEPARLRQIFPGLNLVLCDGKQLGLKDDSVDYVFTHAVIEHVGGYKEQLRFIAELTRVSREGVFITTPNRWFPLELHVFLPFVHYLPPNWFRKILKSFGKQPFDSEQFLNLLSRRDLIRLCLQSKIPKFTIYRQRLFGFTSNLLLYIPKKP